MFFKLKATFADFFANSFGDALDTVGKQYAYFATLDQEGNLYGYIRYQPYEMLARMFNHDATMEWDGTEPKHVFEAMEEGMRVFKECFEVLDILEHKATYDALLNPQNLAYWGLSNRESARKIVEIEHMAKFIPMESRQSFFSMSGFGKLFG